MIFKNYIGDGDFRINKNECIVHVQKKIGTPLRKLVKATAINSKTKTKKIKRKSFSGKGKLTSIMINRLTVYYGLVIRRNHDCVK